MSHPALRSLRTKMTLTEVFRTERGRQLAEAMTATTRMRMQPEHTPSGLPDLFANGAPLAAAMARRLDFATPFWVDSDMVDLTVLAAESRPLSPIRTEDAPAQHGFVLFERAAELRFVLPTGEFDTLTIKAFLWDQGVNLLGQPGLTLTFWSDTTDARDSLAGLLRANAVDPFAALGRLAVAQVAFVPYGHTFSEQHWWAALPATFFNLIAQPIVTTSTAPPDKLMLKHAKRASVMANTVSIITLRRQAALPPEQPAGDPDGPKRKITVRHMVGERTGGFWRRYHANDGERTVWIMPFWRGPEDGPVVFRKDKVYAWKR